MGEFLGNHFTDAELADPVFLVSLRELIGPDMPQAELEDLAYFLTSKFNPPFLGPDKLAPNRTFNLDEFNDQSTLSGN